MNTIKLFTFPYAGGNSNVFRPWKKHLNNNIELIPVEIAGRGSRMFDPLNNSVEDIVDDIQNIFAQNTSDYFLFGHSMGTLIIYELLSLISRKELKQPHHVFFSGRQAPHVKHNGKKKYHLMDNEQFRNEVVKLGGTPEEIFNEPELAELFLPVLKNDFKICETYKPAPLAKKLKINFSVLAGHDEGYNEDELTAYANYTTGKTTIHYFNGGHFFIKDSEKEVIEFINKTLSEYN